MRMINRMIDPTSGTVAVDGQDVSDTDPVKLRRGIGYVIQSGGLMPHQRVIDNVATVPVLGGNRGGRRGRRPMKCLSGWVWTPSWGGGIPRNSPAASSNGSGWRALAADPPILLMDEPFSAVDPVVREELQAEILRLQSELRKTIVFVTHDIDEAIKLGDAVAVFGRGGCSSNTTRPRLLSSPANDFVSAFIGADRGYRALQFCTAADLVLQPIPMVTESEIDALHLVEDEWYLVVREDGSPYGWIDAPGTDRHRVAVCSTTASPPAARCSARTERCGRRWTLRCPPRPASGWPSTTTARSSAECRPTM